MKDVVIKILDNPCVNKEFMADCFREIGLAQDGRPIYGEDVAYMRPDGLTWQKPNQIADFLMHLKNYKIETFLEIGTWKGATFLLTTAFLFKYGLKRALGIDIGGIPYSYELEKILPIEFKTINSDNLHNEQFDLCFIDGDHSYEWVKRDFENVGQFANLCAFHDIDDPWCPGVVKFWNSIKQSYKHYEFVSGGTLGIGLLELKTI